MHIKANRVFFFIALLSISALGVMTAEAAETTENNRLLAGWLESVIMEPWPIPLRAKLDTGAKTSSLHALDIKHFKRDGQPWVQFRTEGKKEGIKTKSIALPIKRDVKIKSHHHDSTVRPVVELSFCLNGTIYHGEFSLVDRSHFNYAVLIGRRILKQGIIVDGSVTFSLPIDSKQCADLFNHEQ